MIQAAYEVIRCPRPDCAPFCPGLADLEKGGTDGAREEALRTWATCHTCPSLPGCCVPSPSKPPLSRVKARRSGRRRMSGNQGNAARAASTVARPRTVVQLVVQLKAYWIVGDAMHWESPSKRAKNPFFGRNVKSKNQIPETGARLVALTVSISRCTAARWSTGASEPAAPKESVERLLASGGRQ